MGGGSERMTSSLQIVQVDAEVVRPLRSSVLRPGQPAEALIYDGDDHPQACHVAAELADEVVGIATVYPEAPPASYSTLLPAVLYAGETSFRLRGMAVASDQQGRGIGAQCLKACFAHIREQGGTHMWCNARVGALTFYERMGLESVGPEFDIPGIGPHYLMWCQV